MALDDTWKSDITALEGDDEFPIFELLGLILVLWVVTHLS